VSNWRDSYLIDFLKTTNSRISISNNWLYYDDVGKEWNVLEHEYGKRHNKVLYRGENLGEALESLEEGWQK